MSLKKMKQEINYNNLISLHGSDILNSTGMEAAKGFIQHGDTSVYEHCLAVTRMSIKLARSLRMAIDMNALIRGCLLHDYFLYDWHDGVKWHRLHGFRHPNFALRNARRDFDLNEVEADMIRSHMFPMTISKVPHHKESVILCIADKIVSTKEVFVKSSQNAS